MTIDLAPISAIATKVNKDWGREIWLENTDLYCAKILELNPGWQCSLHYHLKKTETFLILDGIVNLEIDVDGAAMTLIPGQKFQINPNTAHRFKSVDGATILEISTHHDDADSYRLEPSRRM